MQLSVQFIKSLQHASCGVFSLGLIFPSDADLDAGAEDKAFLAVKRFFFRATGQKKDNKQRWQPDWVTGFMQPSFPNLQ